MSGPGVERESVRERISYLAYATLERTAMALPESLGRPLFDALAIAALPVASRARRVVSENLSRVLGRPPESPIVRAATKEAFRSYARYWYDTFHIRSMTAEEFVPRMRVEGLEHLEAAAARGGGAVLALPHLGNWDAGGHWVALQGRKITAVAEMLRPERLYRLFYDHRVALGMGIVALAEDRKAAEELVQLIAENHVIALVADRDLKGRGVAVEMFGRERMIPAGPALLALGTGAPLHACSCYDLQDGWMFRIGPPIEIERTDSLRADVTTLTRELAERFERSIAASPTQWHMFQPAWEGSERAHAPSAPAAAAST
jgi:KDO2-lipid IV(A) lauroyltransferase